MVSAGPLSALSSTCLPSGAPLITDTGEIKGASGLRQALRGMGWTSTERFPRWVPRVPAPGPTHPASGSFTPAL